MTGGPARARIRAGTGERRVTIFDSVSSAPVSGRYSTGATPGEGTFFCLGCGSQLSMQETDELPDCPRCGGAQYRRDSIFAARQDHGETTAEVALPGTAQPPRWLSEARERHAGQGYFLAMKSGGELRTFAIERGWTRIGRSLTADLRIDDPSVSRRHALVVAEPGKVLRVLDDRSLNGVLVNGKTVEWGPLREGDCLTVGRYSLYVLRN